MTRVVIIHITTIPQTLGFLRSQMRYMRENGFAVHAVASGGDYGELVSVEDQITFHAVEMSRQITPLQDLWSLWKLVWLLSRVRPAIVHAHTPKAGLLGMLAATLSHVPIRVFHLHGAPHIVANGVRRRLLSLATRFSCALAHQVLCVSPSNRDVLISDGTCSASKIFVSANGSCGGVDTTVAYNPRRFPGDHRRMFSRQLRIPHDAFIAAFVGRMVPDKGIADLAEAWMIIRDKYQTAHLIVAGESEAHDPISATAASVLQNDERVHLIGWISDVPSLLASVDLLVHPSYREGFGNASLEASAMCLPVVSTLVPGCVDAVVDGVTGLLVPHRDPVALAGAIERYILDPALRRLHGRAGRLRAIRKFQPLPILMDVHRRYCELLAQRGMVVPDPAALSAPTSVSPSCRASTDCR